jgi:hypothetical protein
MPAACSQCGRPALYATGPPEHRILLCVDCNLKVLRGAAIRNALLERMMNHTQGMAQFVSGLRDDMPPFPMTPVWEATGMTLTNINVSNSNVGVINTGAIESVDVAITALKSAGNEEIGRALQELTNAVLGSTGFPDESKRKEAVDLLSAIATEASAPQETRRPAVVRPLLLALATLIGGIAGIDQLVSKYLPMLQAFFR